METLALVLAILLFIAGLAGTVLPILPGVILIYIGMLLYGFMTHFITLNVTFYIVQGLIMLLIFSIDYLATAIGAKRFGGSRYATWGAAIGTILGLFFGPLGIIAGPFMGAVVGEFIHCSNITQAIRTGIGTLIGFFGGTLFKLIAEIVMIVYFFMSI